MSVEDRVRRQFPSLFITLVSVLIGLFYADLISEARSRMHLWPLDVVALRSWAQIFAMGASAFAAWVVLSHIGASRERLPRLADSIIAFLTPIPLLIGNTFVGRAEVWPWFYYASFYLAVSLVATVWQARLASAEAALVSFRSLLRPSGHLLIYFTGIPGYALAGFLDARGYLSPVLEAAMAASGLPAAMVFCYLFFRDWHRAIAAAS